MYVEIGLQKFSSVSPQLYPFHQVAPNGLLMTFLGGLEAVVSLRHLPSTREFTSEGYHPKKKYKARILTSNTSSKTVGLTLQRQIVAGTSFEFLDMEIGDTYQGMIGRVVEGREGKVGGGRIGEGREVWRRRDWERRRCV